jgi:formamidopyrimidine-DNA glycosylase
MPELPEVQTVVVALQPLVGRRLATARVLRGDVLHGEKADFNAFARGRKIRGVRRHGKRIIFDIGSDRRIQFHLGMTGLLTLNRRAQPLMDHTHLCIRIAATDRELRYRDARRFGGVWLLDHDTAGAGRGLGPLGPDALDIRPAQFAALLGRRRQIKALLLDQRMLAGLGNIYADESLYRARIHPLTRACDLRAEEVRRLLRAIRTTLRSALQAGGSTIRDYRTPAGERGWFQMRHQAYGRQGRPCRRCTTPISRIQVAGRSSHICRKCQRRKYVFGATAAGGGSPPSG